MEKSIRARSNYVHFDGRKVGGDAPVYFIAEIGINHNGSMDVTKKLIDAAVAAGCDAVKFQKRTPELCVPKEQQGIERDTPWGRLTYLDYRYKVEFTKEDYQEIDRYCREKGIQWTASCWDEEAVSFISEFKPPFLKAASASLTDHNLLQKMKDLDVPLIISTGMSTMHQIESAVEAIGEHNLLVAHSTSTYPCPENELNLLMLRTLMEKYPYNVIGYSGHETGLSTTLASVAMGAAFVERHVTLDRAMWGSDQAASVEPGGLVRLLRDIRGLEDAFGDGVKKVYESEFAPMQKLRRVVDTPLRADS